MKTIALALLLVATNVVAQTTNNDDSCDIAQLPAATLLLPYFEVSPSGYATTLFSVQNVSGNPQIARVTIWTDAGYPVLTFNLFLTGYASMPISLADVLLSGTIAPAAKVSAINNPTTGSQPSASNPLIDVSGCATGPAAIPATTLNTVRAMLTTGRDPSACNNSPLGSAHANLIGFATIDLVANCSARGPLDPSYIAHDLLFDNVLTGDYQQLFQGRFVGNALVHIRAVPEGGTAGTAIATTLPYTFYDRLTHGLQLRTFDRRQPLPSTFAPRWLYGKQVAFDSDFRIWREPPFGNDAPCTAYNTQRPPPFAEIVRFDEHENATIFGVSLISPVVPPALPSASRLSISDPFDIPPLLSNDAGGWLWMSLSIPGAARATQAWVVTTMWTSGSAVTNDAPALGNGCSPAPLPSYNAPIGPLP